MSAGRRLARALETSAISAGCLVRVTAAHERPWASATFVGARHTMMLEGEETSELAAWLAALPRAKLAVPGHLLAELEIASAATGAEVHALTLEHRLPPLR